MYLMARQLNLSTSHDAVRRTTHEGETRQPGIDAAAAGHESSALAYIKRDALSQRAPPLHEADAPAQARHPIPRRRRSNAPADDESFYSAQEYVRHVNFEGVASHLATDLRGRRNRVMQFFCIISARTPPADKATRPACNELRAASEDRPASLPRSSPPQNGESRAMVERELTIIVLPQEHANDNFYPPVREIRAPLAETTWRKIRDELLQFKIFTRSGLKQERLAARYGVSRTTIAHVLRRLAGEGLVRPCGHGQYTPVEATVAEIDTALHTICSVLEEIYPPADDKRRRPYCRDWTRSARLARAELVARGHDAELVASEFEILLRRATARAPAHAPLIDACLVTLSRVRRVEGELFVHHARDVAQLIRSFYASRYDNFIEGLVRYTESRRAASVALCREAVYWAACADEENSDSRLEREGRNDA